MKIYDHNLSGTSAAETGRAKESQTAGRAGTSTSSTTAGGGVPADSVEFSGGLSQLSRAISSVDQARANRIQALTAEYQNGTYKVDAMATSKSMIAEAMSAGSR